MIPSGVHALCTHAWLGVPLLFPECCSCGCWFLLLTRMVLAFTPFSMCFHALCTMATMSVAFMEPCDLYIVGIAGTSRATCSSGSNKSRFPFLISLVMPESCPLSAFYTRAHCLQPAHMFAHTLTAQPTESGRPQACRPGAARY